MVGPGRYKWYQSRSPTPDVGACSVWPRNSMGHNEDVVYAMGGGGGGGVCHIPHQIGEKLSFTI